MDSNVWCNCPEDLIERIVARLPFATLVKFRRVCKRWNLLLSSRAFLDNVHRPQEAWFVSGIITANKLAVYAPRLKKWHIPTLPSLNMHGLDMVVVSATMGGLVCLTKNRNRGWPRGHWGPPIDLLIWNPLTNDCKRLPRSTRNCNAVWPGIRFAGMYVNSGTNEYKLITVNRHNKDDKRSGTIVTEVYDSSTEIWRISDSVFPDPTDKQLRYENFCCGSTVYSMKAYSVTEKPYIIFAFDMKTEVWREINAPMDCYIRCPNLVELYDKVFMVGHVVGDGSIRIWRLLEHAYGRGNWIEADRLPQELGNLLATMARKTSLKLTQYWRCSGAGNFLFFRIWESREMLMYSVSGRSWSWLPACDLDSDSNCNYVNFEDIHISLAFSPGRVSP